MHKRINADVCSSFVTYIGIYPRMVQTLQQDDGLHGTQYVFAKAVGNTTHSKKRCSATLSESLAAENIRMQVLALPKALLKGVRLSK